MNPSVLPSILPICKPFFTRRSHGRVRLVADTVLSSCFSTSSNSGSSSSGNDDISERNNNNNNNGGGVSSSLKKLIRPFVRKCHPDTARSQGLPKTAQKVNLLAIQNLNSYVDGTASLIGDEKGGSYPFSSYESGWMEIEFVMSFSRTGTKSANPTTSRRKVELRVPPPTMDPEKVAPHVRRQVVKLLRMADLPVPSSDSHDDYDYDYDRGDEEDRRRERTTDDPMRRGGISEAYMGTQVLKSSSRSKTAWDRSRDQFRSRLNWKKYDDMYQQALSDAQAHQMTKNMIR